MRPVFVAIASGSVNDVMAKWLGDNHFPLAGTATTREELLASNLRDVGHLVLGVQVGDAGTLASVRMMCGPEIDIVYLAGPAPAQGQDGAETGYRDAGASQVLWGSRITATAVARLLARAEASSTEAPLEAIPAARPEPSPPQEPARPRLVVPQAQRPVPAQPRPAAEAGHAKAEAPAMRPGASASPEAAFFPLGMAEGVEAQTGAPAGVVWVITSTDGGVGKTLTSLELAAQGVLHGCRTALVDLNLNNDNLVFIAGSIEENVSHVGLDAIANHDINVTTVKQIASHLVWGPDLFRGKSKSKDLAGMIDIPGERVNAFLRVLQGIYDLVVVDTVPQPNHASTLTALKAATSVLWLTTPGIAAVHNTQAMSTWFRQQLTTARVEVLVNRSARGMHDGVDVSKVVGRKVIGEIPYDDMRFRQVEQSGKPWSLKDRRTAYRAVFEALWPGDIVAAKASRTAFLGGLLRRREV